MPGSTDMVVEIARAYDVGACRRLHACARAHAHAHGPCCPRPCTHARFSRPTYHTRTHSPRCPHTTHGPHCQHTDMPCGEHGSRTFLHAASSAHMLCPIGSRTWYINLKSPGEVRTWRVGRGCGETGEGSNGWGGGGMHGSQL